MIEVLKQALEALELMYACYANPDWVSYKQQEDKILVQCIETIKSTRQAIAELESQEPVAWIEHHKGGDNLNWEEVNHPYAKSTPLYTHPPQRTWVNLTDEEIQAVLDKPEPFYDTMFWFARTIEDKLKEKNT